MIPQIQFNLNFKNKTVLLMGITNPIGLATIPILASLGAKVIFSDTERKIVRDLEKQLRTRGYHNVWGVVVDFSRPENVRRLVKQAINRSKVLDVFINCFQVNSFIPTEKIGRSDWDRVLMINLKRFFLSCQAVVPVMKSQRSGKIVTLCDEDGRQGIVSSRDILYSISMGGLFAFTYSLAFELGPYNINVNAVAPGALKDYFLLYFKDKDKERFKRFLAQTDLKRFGETLEAAYAVVFLASDWANFITGQVFGVNGGLSHN
jgi:3-oxoacyl-[acyl-carrier protein] reductase